MSNHQSGADDNVKIEAIDDFKLIRGIGPVIERKLIDAGVKTYAQLARMSPAKLASIFSEFTLLSEERITQQDWVGQARLLAENYPSKSTGEELDDATHNGQHYAVFTVELLLDKMNAVRRTRVMHVQSQEENTWAGWDENRLVTYFIEKAELPQSLSDAAPLSSELDMQTIQNLEGMRLGEGKLSGNLQLKSLEARLAGFDREITSISQYQPVDLHLTLDLTQVESTLSPQIKYAVTVYSKNLKNSSLYTIGEAEGTVENADDIKIVIKGSQLPVGAYRLEAIAMVSPPSDDSRKHPSLMAIYEGQIVEVY